MIARRALTSCPPIAPASPVTAVRSATRNVTQFCVIREPFQIRPDLRLVHAVELLHCKERAPHRAGAEPFRSSRGCYFFFAADVRLAGALAAVVLAAAGLAAAVRVRVVVALAGAAFAVVALAAGFAAVARVRVVVAAGLAAYESGLQAAVPRTANGA